MKSFLHAWSFLTTIPLPVSLELDPDETVRPLPWFPVIGALVGGLLVGLYLGLVELMPEQARVLVLVLVAAVWVGLKDAFHLDGLADVTDALAGGTNPEQRRDLLEDPSLGPMAGLVLGFYGLIMLTGLGAIRPEVLIRGLVVIPTVSTAVGALSVLRTKSLPDHDGLASYLRQTARGSTGAWLVVFPGLVAAILLGYLGILLLLGGLATMELTIAFLTNRFQGLNGDGCGATIALTQVVLVLMTVTLYSSVSAKGLL